MIQLREAKCPSCGANIQVNDKLENTICQYCGTQVLVEEAIQKYKIEISGKVEVDGIETRKSRLERAKKHLKLKEIKEANEILTALHTEDKFDIDVMIEMIRMKIIALEGDNFTGDEASDHAGYRILNQVLELKDRILKIKDDADFGDLKEKIEKWEQIHEKDVLEMENLQHVSERANLFINKYYLNDKYLEKVVNIINKHFNTDISIRSGHKAYQQYDTYKLSGIKNVDKNGTITVEYFNATGYDKSNPNKLENKYPPLNYKDASNGDFELKDYVVTNYNDTIKAFDNCEKEINPILVNVKRDLLKSDKNFHMFYLVKLIGAVIIAAANLGLFVTGHWFWGLVMLFITIPVARYVIDRLGILKTGDRLTKKIDRIDKKCEEFYQCETKHRAMELGNEKTEAGYQVSKLYNEFYSIRFDLGE